MFFLFLYNIHYKCYTFFERSFMFMNNCIFCNVDKSMYYNTILEETNNFFVIPTKGSLVDGYVLIVSKKHYLNMIELYISID